MDTLVKRIEARITQLPVPLSIGLPSGEKVGPSDAPVRLSFHDWSGLAALAAGEIGRIAEDYVEGRTEIAGRMRGVMNAAANLLPSSPVGVEGNWWSHALRRARSLAHHSQEKDAQQIQFHYDVSDDFYALWLDAKRVYSCAYFREAGMSLDQAQEAKLDHICRKLMLKPGDRFLDIGAGWGGLLLWAAEHYGVNGRGITLSKNQHAHVSRLIEEKGLAGRVRMELRDYRDLNDGETYDKIASVGMFEHVGLANMPAYFARIHSLLKPGGVVMNHGITTGGAGTSQLGAGMGDFIEKYIFPGGELLHVSQVLRDLSVEGLEMVDVENLRPHYARTLWAWSDALEAQLPEARRILTAGGNEERGDRLLRAYRLYLSGCAMCFEQGWIALHQVLATRPDGNLTSGNQRGAQSAYPFNREYMYACSTNSNPKQQAT